MLQQTLQANDSAFVSQNGLRSNLRESSKTGKVINDNFFLFRDDLLWPYILYSYQCWNVTIYAHTMLIKSHANRSVHTAFNVDSRFRTHFVCCNLHGTIFQLRPAEWSESISIELEQTDSWGSLTLAHFTLVCLIAIFHLYIYICRTLFRIWRSKGVAKLIQLDVVTTNDVIVRMR